MMQQQQQQQQGETPEHTQAITTSGRVAEVDKDEELAITKEDETLAENGGADEDEGNGNGNRNDNDGLQMDDDSHLLLHHGGDATTLAITTSGRVAEVDKDEELAITTSDRVAEVDKDEELAITKEDETLAENGDADEDEGNGNDNDNDNDNDGLQMDDDSHLLLHHGGDATTLAITTSGRVAEVDKDEELAITTSDRVAEVDKDEELAITKADETLAENGDADEDEGNGNGNRNDNDGLQMDDDSHLLLHHGGDATTLAITTSGRVAEVDKDEELAIIKEDETLAENGDADEDNGNGIGNDNDGPQMDDDSHLLLHNGGDATTSTAAAKKINKYFLRWNRLCKMVQVKEVSAGLMRSSIAGPSQNHTKTTMSNGSAGASNDKEDKDDDDDNDNGKDKDNNSSKSNNNNKKGPATKTILNQVSAFAAPGSVLALIGPSGSGKTSLLNALSGRTSLESGVISVNGTCISDSTANMKRFVSQVAYVQQEDIFFEHLTIRDQLAYTAFLRLPQVWPRSEKLKEVDRTIRLLRLRHVQNSPIKMLSGGEKKRVNIGTELLTNPSCLLLDEPTSGLDSTSAVALVKLLQTLARSQHKTVLMSIHQPSSGMFLSFDSLLLLAEGNVVYFGTPQQSIQYLKEKKLASPEGYNVADHWMDLLVTDNAMEEEETYMKSSYFMNSSKSSEIMMTNGGGGSEVRNRKSRSKLKRERLIADRRTTRQQLIDAWDGAAVAEQIEQAVQAEREKDGGAQAVDIPNKYNTSWMAQYRVLIHRALKNSRSAIFTPLNMIKSGVLGIISGMLWFQLEYTEKTVHDRTSYFFFTMTYWVFDSMFGALLAFPSERKVILKERASASYHLSAYFMAKTTSEAPTRLTLPLLYMTISFWMAGISTKFSLFVYTTLISLLSVLAGESYGLLVGASVDEMDRAMTTVTVLALSMMLLGGFYVENVPSFIAWAKYFSPFKYAFDASRELVFDEPVPCDGSGELQELCSDGRESVPPDELKEFLEIDGSLAFNIGMLLVLGFVPRYFAYLALKAKKGGDR